MDRVTGGLANLTISAQPMKLIITGYARLSYSQGGALLIKSLPILHKRLLVYFPHSLFVSLWCLRWRGLACPIIFMTVIVASRFFQNFFIILQANY